MGTHIERTRDTGRVVGSVNNIGQNSYDLSTVTTIESVLANLRYYNPSAPATLTTASGTTGTYQKEFLIKRNYAKFFCRNNYQVPCEVSLYLVVPKEDTSITPLTAFQNGLADVGNPSSTSPLVYPSDSPQFMDLWKIVKTKKAYLLPGKSCQITHSTKSFQYDPSLVDSHSLTYQSRYGSMAILVRVEGPLGHDTTANEQGSLVATLDYQIEKVIEIKYSAGADIKYIISNDNSNTFTNGGVVSNMPVSDNQQYSIP